MSILVTGGTGAVGSNVVRNLIARSRTPRVMTRSPEKAAQVPAGAVGVVGDMGRPETLGPALAGIERVVLITALSEREEQEGLAVVTAAAAASVKRIVYMSVHDVHKVPEAPHFASKTAIQAAIERSGLEWTFVMPNNFYQNDYWFQQPITQYGVYPQPIGERGCQRVDTRDIADAMTTAVLEDGHAGERYPLVGPEVWTGTSTAAAWSRHLGREVRYGGDDLDAWAAQAGQMLPAWLVADLKIMYGAFQKTGLPATDADLAQQERILRRSPRRFDDFAAETAAAWR
ncbi:MAG: NmrA family NAD(P)-binding protein [Acidobacteria bacterium]|nr:NmrA family NAD(P)-binding protein [Acidobacteriota bacterium]